MRVPCDVVRVQLIMYLGCITVDSVIVTNRDSGTSEARDRGKVT